MLQQAARVAVIYKSWQLPELRDQTGWLSFPCQVFFPSQRESESEPSQVNPDSNRWINTCSPAKVKASKFPMSRLFSPPLLDRSLYGGKETVGLRECGVCAPKSSCPQSVLDCVPLREGRIRDSLLLTRTPKFPEKRPLELQLSAQGCRAQGGTGFLGPRAVLLL